MHRQGLLAGANAPGAGDLLGGLAAAAILLPQAMAFGVTLFAIGHFDASAGAYAGLVGTAMLCIASGVAGGTRGLITAPTGPTLVLLGSALGGLVAAGLEGGALALGLAATIVLTGALQFAIGASGGGRLIKYIPFPVVSGFMTGSAILMIKSQLKPLSGTGATGVWTGWWWLPAAAAAITILGTKLVPRVLPQVPGPIAGLVLGTLAFHLGGQVVGVAPPEAWMIGALPGFSADSVGFAWQDLGALPWPVIVPAAVALAVLASLDTLLTAVVADVATGTRHDSRRELMGQGVGQAASALLGGMAGAGTTAATVIAIKSGGGRWVGVGAGVVFLALTAFAGDAGKLLPIGALAGVIIAVAFDVADLDILTWARQGRTRQDAAIAVLVTAITVGYDLMIAVGVGVAIAILLFIREQIKAPVVHRRSTASEMRSIRSRPQAERTLLDQHGHRIVIYELRGNLFFGTADRLIDELGSDLDSDDWIILHLRKVSRIDLTAVRFLQQIANRLHEHGGTLLCCELHAGTGIDGSFAEAFRMASRKGVTSPVLTFNGRDEALEFAENALLEALELAPTRIDDFVALADNAIARYLTPAQAEALAAHLPIREIKSGAHLFHSGETTDEVYLVARGQIEIRLATTAHHHKRLAIYGAGTFFGELALLKSGPRAADAIATADTRCWVLERATFEDIKVRDPALAIALLAAICDVLVANQRWSTRELQRLSEW
ncbi:MAG: SLC26A/SulP transporter family protein [Gammaproteobacteria bacterium]|nr:SLC26A/SulP transporter family protein [Gammaproteobacteria bacterium]MCP5200780.1 SLC26A/SulP transporter family protein [Gammaproteobacteria bacterium]